MTNWVALRQAVPEPTHLAVAGFGIAGTILVGLDLQRPAWAVTNTISSYATGPAAALYMIALLAASVGVGAAMLTAWRSAIRLRPGGLLLMVLWPIGIAIGVVFNQAEHTFTGMVHNVAVGAAIAGVHLAAVRMGSRPLKWIATAGFACMAAMIALLVAHSFTGLDMPVGAAERVLVGISVVLVVGTFRVHRRLGHSAGMPFPGNLSGVRFAPKTLVRSTG